MRHNAFGCPQIRGEPGEPTLFTRSSPTPWTGASDPKAAAALEAFEPLFFNNLTLVLDRYFVHRFRMVAGKDGNPLNEVELLTESLMNNDGVLRGNTVVRFVPDQSVLKLAIGDRIRLSAAQFEQLAKAFFAEVERSFLKDALQQARRRARDDARTLLGVLCLPTVSSRSSG